MKLQLRALILVLVGNGSLIGCATNQSLPLLFGVSVPQADGNNTQLSSTVPHQTLAGAEAKDAFSVLGQFEVDSNGRQVEVGLGKFFATGLAAQKLADGFACKLGNNCSTPTATKPK